MICICVVERLKFERRLYRLLRFYRCYGLKARPKLIQHQNQSVSKRLNNHSSCKYLIVLAQHFRYLFRQHDRAYVSSKVKSSTNDAYKSAIETLMVIINLLTLGTIHRT